LQLTFDNTLCDSLQVWHNLYAGLFPEKRPIPKISDLTDWSLEDKWNVEPWEKELLFNIFRRKAIKYASPMDSNCWVWINKLIEEGHELFILTSNPEWMQENIHYWLSEFGLELPIICTNSIEDKRDHWFDLLIDDSPQAYRMTDWNNDGRRLAIYHQPYNVDLELGANLHRVYNFRDVYNLVLELIDE